jgi:hypothetical protein
VRWRAPRWVFETWLWASVVAAVLESWGCPSGRLFQACVTLGNATSPAFDLFPASLGLAFHMAFGNDVAALVSVAVCTGGCHWLARRFLPSRLALRRAGLLIAAWAALSWTTEFLTIWVLAGRPPIPRLLTAIFTG